MDSNQFYRQNMPVDEESEKKKRASDALGKASMVLGIVSIATVFCCMPFVFSAVSMTLAILSKGASKTLSTYAKTGLICSIIGFAASMILTVFMIVVECALLFNGLTKNGNVMDTFIKNYEQQYEDTYGQELPPEMKELFENYSNQ